MGDLTGFPSRQFLIMGGMMQRWLSGGLTMVCGGILLWGPFFGEMRGYDRRSFLDNRLVITWYGNPHTGAMGVLGQREGAERAAALKAQMAKYREVTARQVTGAYHLVAAVAQPQAGPDDAWRRRESAHVIENLLDEAREHGFELILDLQPGRASVVDEVRHLRRFLADPRVHLALDPEFAMTDQQVPGREIGQLRSSDINDVIDILESIITREDLPNKVLILYQFTLGMLPDKERIEPSDSVDIVLCMDGIGSPALKLDTYRAVMRQGRLPFAGFKLFFDQDPRLMSPAQLLELEPAPAVISYQ